VGGDSILTSEEEILEAIDTLESVMIDLEAMCEEHEVPFAFHNKMRRDIQSRLTNLRNNLFDLL